METAAERVSEPMTPQPLVPADDPDGLAPPVASGLHPVDPIDDMPAGESGPAEVDDTAEGGSAADADGSGAFAGPPPDVDAMRTAERGREADAARADTSDSVPTPTETPLETPSEGRG